MSGEAERRVEVVRIIARLNVGGPAQHVMHLTAGLTDRRPTLLVAGRVGEGEGDMTEAVRASGAAVRVLPELGRRIRPWSDIVALVKLVRLLRRLRPTIVHTHTAKAGILGRVAAIAAGVPIRVHTFHGHIFRGYFGRWTTRTILVLERLLARATARIIAVSESQARELAEEFRVCERERIRVVPLGLELDRFASERAGRHRAAFRAEIAAGESTAVLTTVGRLAPIKNHGLLLDAAAALVREGRDCVVCIVGGGTEEAALRARARALGIADRVRLLGWRRDVERVYAGSDVVALTSDNEGTPVSLIEALAAGRAIVATDVGGVADVLEGGRLGELVPPRDARALADAIGRLLDEPGRRAEYGRRGASAARRRFGVARLLRDTDTVYNDLIRQKLRGIATRSPDTPVES